jgi:hypothetical protein
VLRVLASRVGLGAALGSLDSGSRVGNPAAGGALHAESLARADGHEFSSHHESFRRLALWNAWRAGVEQIAGVAAPASRCRWRLAPVCSATTDLLDRRPSSSSVFAHTLTLSVMDENFNSYVQSNGVVPSACGDRVTSLASFRTWAATLKGDVILPVRSVYDAARARLESRH